VAAFFLVGELAPHVLWQFSIGAHGGFGHLIIWDIFAMICWLVLGVGLGIVVPLIAPLRRLLIDPFQSLIAGVFGLVGMKTLAGYWSPNT
jgi:hypothetical protein